MSKRYVIRKAVAADAAGVWQLRIAAIRSKCPPFYPQDVLAAWTAGAVSDEFRKTISGDWYVAVSDSDRVVASGKIDLVSGMLDGIFVDPNVMGRGLGRQMMDHLEALARHAGIRKLTLDSTLNAADFYRRCGFGGDAVSTYCSPRGLELDCIPMVKHIADEGQQSEAQRFER